jgi:hypothetical protein
MRRKVIKQKDSYTMTLPMKWATAHGIGPNSELDIEIEKEALVVKANSSPAKKEGEIVLPKNCTERLVRYIINNAYRSGYDVLKVKQVSRKNLETIEGIIDILLGWQITKRNNDEITFENLTEPNADKFDSLMRRSFFIILDDLRTLPNKITSQKTLVEDITKSGKEVMMIDNFCRRCISKKAVEKDKTSYYWMLISTMVWSHRSLSYLAESLKEHPYKKDKAIESLIAKIISAFENINEGIFSKDFSKISKVFEITEEIEKKKSEYLQSNNKIIAYYLLEMTRMLALSCSPSLGIMI